MTLLKTSLLSFIATACRLLSGLVVNKAAAIYLGPMGLALVGQLQNFIQIAMTFAQGGLNTGITKYVAEYKSNENKISLLFSTAARISLATSITVGAFLTLLSKMISLYVLKNGEYYYIFMIFGVTIFFFVCNNLLLSVLNGLKEVKTWTIISISQSFLGLILTTTLIKLMNLEGVLLALVLNQSATFLVVIMLLKNHSQIKPRLFFLKCSNEEAKKLAKYSLMTLSSAIVIPISHFSVREYLGKTLSWEEAGYWQAICYISNMYLMVVTTTLSTYYLPRLSEISCKHKLRVEIFSACKIVLPTILIASSFVFFLRDFIILLLFSPDFLPMRDLFLWQLAGDVVKLLAWLFAYVMLAKAMMKTFILTEIIFSLCFIGMAMIFVETYGLVGTSYAFVVNYTLYLIVVVFFTRKEWSHG